MWFESSSKAVTMASPPTYIIYVVFWCHFTGWQCNLHSYLPVSSYHVLFSLSNNWPFMVYVLWWTQFDMAWKHKQVVLSLNSWIEIINHLNNVIFGKLLAKSNPNTMTYNYLLWRWDMVTWKQVSSSKLRIHLDIFK